METKMLSMEELELAKRYAPIIHFDEHEPFFPVRIGISVLHPGMGSPSFNRIFPADDSSIKYIIEYAIYWDYDIQHLYELEHVWIYVGHDESVKDCEASFHGDYMKGWFLSNRDQQISGTKVKLYSQPGKHAFSPDPRLFELIPNYSTCTYETAGSAGLIITDAFTGVYETNEKINQLVETYLQKFRFKPSGNYKSFTWPEDIFVSWEKLREEIPQRIQQELAMIEKELDA